MPTENGSLNGGKGTQLLRQVWAEAGAATEVRLRKCPRCSCGSVPTSTICEFCGAVFAHIAAVGEEISGLVCNACGEQNSPAATECRGCGQALTISCPRCGHHLHVDAVQCGKCDLPKSAFFDDCIQKELKQIEAQLRQRRRADVFDNVVAFVMVTVLAVLAWWQGLRNDAIEWQLWLFLTVLYVLMWVLGKRGR